MHSLQENKEKVTCLFKHKKLGYIRKYGCGKLRYLTAGIMEEGYSWFYVGS